MGQNNQFSFLTWLQLRQALAQRLNDTANTFWSDAENKFYLTEALQFWNTLTAYWPQDFNVPVATGDWISTSDAVGSPRIQTSTESDLYSILLYHLMEPQLNAGVWTGTSQFNVTDLQQSAQYGRDEILENATSNVQVITVPGPLPNTSRIYLPDNVLDVRRVRYLGSDGTVSTLIRGDSDSFLRFSPQYKQTSATPRRWDVLGSPPLALTFDTLVNQPSQLEVMVMEAGNTLNPQNPQLLQMPNDWLFVLKYRVLYDLLSMEAESTDHQRANYCKKRYDQGLQLVKEMPWLLNAFLNEVAVDTVAVTSKDRNSVNWQTNPDAWPNVVIADTDLFAICPTATSTFPNPAPIAQLTLMGNAPIPVLDGDFVQAPRDVVDVVLDYAQHLASFKNAGDEFFETMPLYQNFIQYALKTSQRLRMSGIFETDLRPPVTQEELAQPREAVSS